jgi:hypothetical protein
MHSRPNAERGGVYGLADLCGGAVIINAAHTRECHRPRGAGIYGFQLRVGVRGFNSFRYGSWGGRRFVGGFPYYDDGFDVGLGLVGVGLGLATADYAYYSPYDYSYYGYCGPNSVVGW